MGKSLFYARNICLADDGVFLRFMWEVMTERGDSLGNSGSDQWIGRERSTVLKALWVNVRTIEELGNSDEIQMSWDDALEMPLTTKEASEPAKAKGKGEHATMEMPPPGPKQKKPVSPTTHSDAPEVSTPGVGAIPASGSEAGGAIPLVKEQGQAAGPSGQVEDGQYASLLGMHNDKAVEENARSYPHSPATWKAVWLDITKDAENNKELMKMMKMVIWQQTLMTLGNDQTHMVLDGLATLSPTKIVHQKDLIDMSLGKAGTRTNHVDVLKIDCLEVVQSLNGKGFERMAVLNMASKISPGGGVSKGKGAQEEDFYRRTDISRHTKQWYRTAVHYPLNSPHPVAMIVKDVTIIRGPCDEGYPFLQIRNKIDMIAMAAQNEPSLIKEDDVAYYGLVTERHEMRMKIRVMLKAMIDSGCDAVVVSAFGCGAYKHPPEEVATLFREEIETAGPDLPTIVFAILDDHNAHLTHNPKGNFEVFERILKKNRKLDAVKQTPSQAGMGGESGPGATLSSGPEEQGGMEVQDEGGESFPKPSSNAPVLTYAASFESGTDISPPFPSSSEGQGTAPSASSGGDVHMNSTVLCSSPSHEIEIFQQRVKGTQRSAERIRIFEGTAAVCLDCSGTALLRLFVGKFHEVVKWRFNWDKCEQPNKMDRARKGQQRRGTGVSSASYDYDGETPPFEPQKNTEIEKQVADMIDFAYYRCYIPEAFWLLSEAIKMTANPDGYNLDPAYEGDPRIVMMLRLVVAMYNKRYCSFVRPRGEQEMNKDTHYFPENAALLDVARVTGLVAAAMMIADPHAEMGQKVKEKGRQFLRNQALMICDVQQPTAGSGTGTEIVPSSSSSSAPQSKALPKKRLGGKQPAPEEYDKVD
jgi:uncharacterized protein (TIGR02452 family)